MAAALVVGSTPRLPGPKYIRFFVCFSLTFFLVFFCVRSMVALVVGSSPRLPGLRYIRDLRPGIHQRSRARDTSETASYIVLIITMLLINISIIISIIIILIDIIITGMVLSIIKTDPTI